MMPVPQPVVLDNNVLACFACINRMDLLLSALGPTRVLEEVVAESRVPDWLRVPVDNAIATGLIAREELPVAEQHRYVYFNDTKLLEEGESASLAWLQAQGGGTIASDEYSVMVVAREHGFKPITTLSILYFNFRQGNLSQADGNRYLAAMREKPRGAYFPPYIHTFDDVIQELSKPQAARRLV